MLAYVYIHIIIIVEERSDIINASRVEWKFMYMLFTILYTYMCGVHIQYIVVECVCVCVVATKTTTMPPALSASRRVRVCACESEKRLAQHTAQHHGVKFNVGAMLAHISLCSCRC